jgi:hypothetical protein
VEINLLHPLNPRTSLSTIAKGFHILHPKSSKSLRIAKTGWYWLNSKSDATARCITPKVLSAVVLARSWISNVTATRSLVNPAWLDFQSSVAESQLEGIVKFAEQLAWPYLPDVRACIESLTAPPDILRMGPSVLLFLWDWLHGLTTPGGSFSQKTMIALTLCTPQLKTVVGASSTGNVGLILPDRSYWRQSTAMGRVMGGLKSVKSAAGWIGPCPVPTIGNSRSNSEVGWKRAYAESVSPPKIQYSGNWPDDPPELGALAIRPGEDPVKYIEELEDESRYILPRPPATSTVPCKLVSTRLEILPADVVSSTFGENNHRAHLKFDLGSTEAVEYCLGVIPIFVSAHPCYKGPHLIHSRELPDFTNVWEVGKLKSAPHPETQKSAMIINATSGDGELLARAWCAEVRSNAVIRRQGVIPTCLACAVRMASNISLGINVLIWS